IEPPMVEIPGFQALGRGLGLLFLNNCWGLTGILNGFINVYISFAQGLQLLQGQQIHVFFLSAGFFVEPSFKNGIGLLLGEVVDMQTDWNPEQANVWLLVKLVVGFLLFGFLAVFVNGVFRQQMLVFIHVLHGIA